MDSPLLMLRGASGRRSSGFSVIEAVIAVAIIGLALGAMMTLNGHELRMVKMARDTNAATLYQQERVEQLRQARWPDLTSGNYIANTYMGSQPPSKAALDKISESILVAAYPSPSAGSSGLKVTRGETGAAVIDSSLNGYALTNERLVRVDMQLSWKGSDGRARSRRMSTLISNSGVTRSNLPALGPVSGGAWDTFATPTPQPSGTPSGGSPTPGPGAGTPTPGPVVPTPVPVSTPGNNGNGNGRGNTGGKGGKG